MLGFPQSAHLVVVAAAVANGDDGDDEGQHQLTTFNHQSEVMVGGKTDDSGNAVRHFHGTISGTTESRVICVVARRHNGK